MISHSIKSASFVIAPQNLLNLDSFSALLSILMTWILLLFHFRYWLLLLQILLRKMQAWEKRSLIRRILAELIFPCIESIYPHFRLIIATGNFKPVDNGLCPAVTHHFNRNSDAGVNGYYNLFLMANPKGN